MRPRFKRWVFLLLTSMSFCYCILTASARDEPRSQAMSGQPISRSNSPSSLTGKERLGRKWMDEQRIDNCKVPADKRGSAPRPTTCNPTRPDRPS
jgi:hypothetical protein